MSRPEPRRRRLLALITVAFLLGILATPGASAQTEGEADVSQFGGFIASARSNGLQITYDSPGLLPTGSPILQVSIPEALATLNSGPVGYALSSFAYPGPLVADLGAALEASGTETGIPPYPVRSEAFFPSGPTAASAGEQGIEMTATTEHADSLAQTSYSGLELEPAGSIGAVSTRSQSLIEGDQIISRTRAAVSDVSLLAGLVKIDSVVTEIVATSNGTEGATAGGTTVSGLEVLGLPARLDGEGIRFEEPPPAPGAEPNPVDDALGDVLGGALDPVQEGLTGLAGPLNELLDQVGAAGDEALQQLFEASGIEIEILDNVEKLEGGSASRIASGLSITIDYDGANTPVLTDLLALIPSDDLPAENLGPVPFSPQAIAKLLDKQHIPGFAIAPASVSTEATPAFEFEPETITPSAPTTSGSTSTGTGSTGSTAGSDFETAAPDLPDAAPNEVMRSTPVATENPFPLGDAIPALVVFGVVLGTPFFAAGSGKLADNTLAAVGSTCPDGLDGPPEEIGP